MRVGKFTSSQIYRLCSFGRGAKTIENVGAAFGTYVKEKKWERKLGKPLNKEVNARPTTWGTLVEHQAFSVMGLKYQLKSDERYEHSKYGNYWSGSPDLLTDEVVGDIKSPYTLESFIDLLEIIEDGTAENFKRAKPSYYWQLVSNAILCGKEKALFVVYVPYKEELDEIRELSENTNEENQNKYAWINWAEDNELPYIKKESGIKNLNMFQFDIPQEDKDFLTARVELAINQLK